MTKVSTKNTNVKNRQLYLDMTFLGVILFQVFRIPLTNMIGNEGNGYLAFALEVYAVLSLIFGYAVSRVTMKMIKLRSRKHLYQTCSHIFVFSLMISLILSLLGSVIFFFGISYVKLNYFPILAGISFKFFSGLLIISSISGVFRGYFEGIGTQVPTAFSKLLEAFIAGTGALIFTSSLTKYGTKVGALLINKQYTPAFGAAGIVLGCICGAVFSLLFLIFIKKIYSYAQNHSKQKGKKDDTFNFKSIFVEFFRNLAICIGELLFFKGYRLLNLMIFSNIYTKMIEGENKLLAIVGAYHGKVLVLITLSVLIILSFTGENIIRIRKNYIKRMTEYSLKYLYEDLKKILIISIPVCTFIFAFSKNILTLLYRSASTTEILYLKIASVNVVLVSLGIYFYKVLRKLEFNISLLVIPVIAFAGQSIMMYFLVNIENTRTLSFIIAELVFWGLICVTEYVVILNALKPDALKVGSYLKRENE